LSFSTNGQCERLAITLPANLGGKVASWHLPKIGVKLTKMASEQSKYLDLAQTGGSRRITPGINAPAAY
jgi:S-adenosylhomocysteine hydrolase